MRIKEIEVTNLFGVFHHVVSLKVYDRITIIHGPNGYGKTALLRMIDYLFNNQYESLAYIDFEKFTVVLENNVVLTVSRTVKEVEKEAGINYWPTLRLSGNAGGQEFESITLYSPPDEGTLIASWRPEDWSDVIATPSLLGHVKSGQLISPRSRSMTVGNSGGYITSTWLNLPSKREEPKWWSELRASVKVRLIETQRLSRSLKSQNQPSSQSSGNGAEEQFNVTAIAKELMERIRKKKEESGEVSQSLDSTFPYRLVQGEGFTELPDDEIRKKLVSLSEKRRRLREAGLEEEEEGGREISIQQADTRTRAALSIYVQDSEKKLAVFDDLLDRVEMFKQVLNELFVYKKIVISKKYGFHIGVNKKGLWPHMLSSGEQHEVVLLYELLFRVTPGSLVMIDEPELSLHVEWQRMFLDILERIANKSSIDVLVATHSPQIINDRRDLMVQLKGPVP